MALALAGCGGAGAERAAPARAPAAAAVTARPEPTAPAPAVAPAAAEAEDAAYPGDDVADEVAAEGGAGAALAVAGAAPPPHPLDGWTDDQIAAALRDAPERLGSISLGSPNAGRLWGGVQMPEGEGWVRVDAAHAWGTEETVAALIACVEIGRASCRERVCSTV